MTSDGERGQRRYVVRDDAEAVTEPRRYVPPGTAVGAPPRRVTGRMVAIGVAAAVILGALLALLLRPNLDEEPERETRVAAATQGEERGPRESEFRIRAAQEEYRAPDRDAVGQAYADAGRVYAAEGVSGLARNGLECFRRLEQASTYRQLDYCLAFDAFAAAINQRVAGGQPAPPDSYFGQAADRHLTVAQQVMGQEGDASARLTDLRRIAIEVARMSAPPVQNATASGATAVAAAPPAALPPATVAAPAVAEPAQPRTTVAAAPAAPARQPATSRPAATQPPASQAAASPTPARRVAAEPAPAPVPAPRRAAAESPPAARLPTAQEVAAARPTRSEGPSFNCRYARTASERMVCSRPDLAAADRRLNEAYEDAIASGADRAALRLEQDRWLALREGAAPDPNAVRDIYERRIRELQGRR